MNLTTNLQDAHIYIFKQWVIELICRNDRISSLRTDLLPVLAKMQWQSHLRSRERVSERTLSTHPNANVRAASRISSHNYRSR